MDLVAFEFYVFMRLEQCSGSEHVEGLLCHESHSSGAGLGEVLYLAISFLGALHDPSGAGLEDFNSVADTSIYPFEHVCADLCSRDGKLSIVGIGMQSISFQVDYGASA